MRIYIFSVLTCFLLLLTSCSQYFQDPVAYNDSLVDIYNAAVNDFNAYDTYYVETSWQFFDNIENRRIRTIDTLQQKKIELEILPELRGDPRLRDILVKDIVSMIGILENEYKDLLDTYKRYENNEISEEEYNQIISSISNVIIEKTRLGDNEVQEIQNDFSKKFDYEVLPIE